MTEVFNKTAEKEKRRDLRNNLTEAEKIVWNKIRSKQINGKKFRRQVSIGSYVVDFYCSELKLIVEIDGGIHETADAKEYVNYRDTYMQSLGLTVIRYKNDDIFNNIDTVIENIEKICKS